MENHNEAVSAPTSDVAKEAIANLQKEGFELGSNPIEENEFGQVVETKIPKEEPKKEETKSEPKKEEKTEKPAKEPSKTETWRVRVQENKWEKEKEEMQNEFKTQVAELQQKVEELSKSKMTVSEKAEIADEIEEIAKEFGLDDANKNLIKKLEQSILKKVSLPKEVAAKIEGFESERIAINQEKQFNSEFETDVLPLIRAEYPNISDSSLSEVKAKILETAFREEYLKVPLKKIFKAEQDELGISEVPHKKGLETSKSGQNRATETVDFDKMDEETFLGLPADKKLEFSKYQSSKKWR